MRLSVAALLAAISLLALVPIAVASTGTGSSSGYVTYSVQASYNGTSQAATVTENVAPSSTAGESIVQLSLQGTESNFTYSHVVNDSLTLFPYLPAISSDSYSYSGKNYTVSATISQHGTSQVTFQAKSYTLTDYSFTVLVTSSNGSDTITGTLTAFPSDLVYSVTAHGQTSSVQATLTSTSLALTSAAASPSTQATSAGVGLSIAAGAVAVSLGVKYRHKAPSEGPKPDHWVD